MTEQTEQNPTRTRTGADDIARSLTANGSPHAVAGEYVIVTQVYPPADDGLAAQMVGGRLASVTTGSIDGDGDMKVALMDPVSYAGTTTVLYAHAWVMAPRPGDRVTVTRVTPTATADFREWAMGRAATLVTIDTGSTPRELTPTGPGPRFTVQFDDAFEADGYGRHTFHVTGVLPATTSDTTSATTSATASDTTSATASATTSATASDTASDTTSATTSATASDTTSATASDTASATASDTAKDRYERLVATIMNEAATRGWGTILTDLFSDAGLPFPAKVPVTAKVEAGRTVFLYTNNVAQVAEAAGLPDGALDGVTRIKAYRTYTLTLDVPDQVTWVTDAGCRCEEREDPYPSGKKRLPTWIAEQVTAKTRTAAGALGQNLAGWAGFENDVTLSCPFCA